MSDVSSDEEGETSIFREGERVCSDSKMAEDEILHEIELKIVRERMTELQRKMSPFSLLQTPDRKRPQMRTDAIGSQCFFFYSKNNLFTIKKN